jgi:hypothetical protein
MWLVTCFGNWPIRGGQISSAKDNILKVYTLSKLEDKQSKKKYFDYADKHCVNEACNVKISLLRKGSLFCCSNRMAFNKPI